MAKKIKPLFAVKEIISNQESKEAVNNLIKFTNSISSKDLKELETTLAADFARLFLSINKVPPHPSESTYREGTMMQYYRDEVLKTYWSFGVSNRKDFTEPEDHIATELSFMAFLCEKACDSLSKGNSKEAKKYVQAQKEFIETHLNKWVPLLVRDIIASARTPFYKGIAALTKEFLEMNLSATTGILNQLKV
jgi:putative dimethyl sulfoxide reductase chaperone